MRKATSLLVLGALAAGVYFAGYNAMHYEVLQPFPLAWNRLPEEVHLLELEGRRRTLVAKLGSVRRMGSVGGLQMPVETMVGEVDRLNSELTTLDERIMALRAEIAAIRARPR